MTVDELLANPAAAAELPDGAVPTHAILIVEYTIPRDQTAFITSVIDDTLPLWAELGLLHYALWLAPLHEEDA